MAVWNLGSIADTVLTLVDNVPSSISGAMLGIADRERLFAEQFTGQSIGSTGIDEKWQGPLVNLTAAEVMFLMQLQGVDATGYRLGDMQVSKGSTSNLTTASQQIKEDALRKLKAIGNTVRFYKANG